MPGIEMIGLGRLTGFTLAMTLSLAAAADLKRTPSGRPDLSGVYDTGTLTPTQRPEWLGETESLYPWFAKLLNWGFSVAAEWAITDESDPDREAPPEGGDGNNAGGAGGVLGR